MMNKLQEAWQEKKKIMQSKNDSKEDCKRANSKTWRD